MEARWIVPKATWKDFTRNFMESPDYYKDETRNAAFIRATLLYLNRKVVAVGWITLNDVWDALGLPRTKEGMIYGFTMDNLVEIDYEHGYVTVGNCRIIYDEVWA